MPKLTINPTLETIDLQADWTLREGIRELELPLQDRCGGSGVCGGCAVRVVEGELSEKTAAEEALYGLKDNERLSCQCRALTDITVELLE